MYRGRLRRDLDLWVAKGLLGRETADALVAELDTRGQSFSLGGVLMILAAVLLSAAILMLIAAGWEAIPRLVKVGGAFLLIWVFHLGAAWAFSRQARRFGAALLVMGGATFGGAVALLGQVYHLSGDAVDALLLWFAMAALSSALFRSGAVAAGCGLLAWAVFLTLVFESVPGGLPFYMAAVAVCGAVVIALAVWSGQERVAHFSYLLALGYAFWLFTLHDTAEGALAIAGLGLGVFLAVAMPASPLARRAGHAGPALSVYALAFALMGMGLLHIFWDEGLGLTLLAVATIGVTLGAIVVAGRDNGAVRLLAYVAFAAEILYIAFVTIDTMLGTSGFFLLSGVVVAVLAFLVVRLERLFARRRTGGQA